MHDLSQFGQRMRQLRQQRHISQRALAETAGMAVSYLTKVENGKASPTLGTLMKLADALGITLVELLTTPTPVSDRLTVVPVAEMPVVDDGDKRWRYLFPHHPRIKVIITDEVYQPHTLHAEVEKHPHDICGVVLSGVLSVEIPTSATVTVQTGEAYYLRAGTPHISRNTTDEPLHLLIVELPDTRVDAGVGINNA